MLLGHDNDLDRRVANGEFCTECLVEFTEGHGHPVACHYCWKLLSRHEQSQTAKATHREKNRLANEELGRERKKQRLAKRVEKD